jgi:hypothetical protein
MEFKGETMKTLGVLAIGLLLTNALVAGEDSKPDFSGTWRFNQEKSKLETIVPNQSELILVIEHKDPEFKMTRTLTLGEKADTLSWEATTDGMENHRKDGDFESRMRMTWTGDELILESRLTRHGEQGTNEAHYRLADEGKTLIAAEWFHMPSSRHHNYWVFDKEPEP